MALLIRNRDEMKRHLLNLVDMTDAELNGIRQKTAWSHARREKEMANPVGRRAGLMYALDCVRAWEEIETTEALGHLLHE